LSDDSRKDYGVRAQFKMNTEADEREGRIMQRVRAHEKGERRDKEFTKGIASFGF
jgi:hypothetical protein